MVLIYYHSIFLKSNVIDLIEVQSLQSIKGDFLDVIDTWEAKEIGKNDSER